MAGPARSAALPVPSAERLATDAGRRLAGLLYEMLRDGTPYTPPGVPRHAAESAAPV